MKKIYLLFLLLCVTALSAQQWQWLTGIEQASGGFVDQIAVDGQGNSYTYAIFQQDIITSEYELYNTNPQNHDTYFTKFNSVGQRQWIRQLTGTGSEIIRGLDVDAAGNVYIAGSFTNGISFGTVSFTGAGSFVAKYDTGGTLIWAKKYTISFLTRIAVSDTGNIFLAGGFQVPLQYGAVTLTNSTTNNSVSYLLKLDAQGEIVWGRMADTTSNGIFTNGVYGLTTDASGNVYMSGWHAAGNVILGSITLLSAQNDNFFVVKYNADGVEQWARRAGNNSCANSAYNVSVDSQGNVYVIGSYCANITVEGTLLSGTSTSLKPYIIKYNSAGTLVWAKTSVSNGTAMLRSADIDASGNLIVAGNYEGTLNLGNNITITSPTMAKFIAKYSAAGTPLWITGSSEIDYNNEISVECYGTNTIYCAGSIIGVPTFSFGGINYTKTGENLYNIHVGKMLDMPLSNTDFKAVQASVYPNPVTNIATVESVSPVVNIIVHDINGRKVGECFNSNNVNMEKLSRGVYIFNIYTDKGASVVKVVKQ